MKQIDLTEDQKKRLTAMGIFEHPADIFARAIRRGWMRKARVEPKAISPTYATDSQPVEVPIKTVDCPPIPRSEE